MGTYTLRWSADRSLYFVEPARGRNARGFWLGCDKNDYPVPPEIIRNPYSGAFAFDGYWRRWFSMRGFIVRQGLPEIDVPGQAELVRDYICAEYLVTPEEAKLVIETNRIEAEAAEKAAADAWFENFGNAAADHFARQAVICEKPDMPERPARESQRRNKR
jgi:hypothetical protein